VHPNPLFRVAQQHPLQSRIVSPGIAADRLPHVVALDQRQRLLKPEYMRVIRFPPTVGRNHRRARVQGQDGQALERPGRVLEKIYRNAVALPGVLIVPKPARRNLQVTKSFSKRGLSGRRTK